MKSIIICIIFISTICLGHPGALSTFTNAEFILNPQATPGVFVLSNGDYEDFRIDSNLDGKIDFWRVKKGNTSVAITFENNQVRLLQIKRLSATRVSEVFYSNKSGKILLDQVLSREPNEMFFSKKDGICEATKNTLQNDLNAIGDVENLFTVSAAKELIDPGCAQSLGNSSYRGIQSYLSSFLRGKDTISECLSSEKMEKAYSNTPDNKLGFAILKASMNLQRAQMLKNLAHIKPLIMCSRKDDEKNNKLSISTKENGKISIAIPDGEKEPVVTAEQLRHEFLHKGGLFTEDSVNKFMTNCSLDSAGKIVSVQADVGLSQTFDTSKANANSAEKKSASTNETKVKEVRAPANSTERFQGSVNAAASSTANIPKELTVAQTNIPSSESLSQTIYSNPQKTPAGIETAYNNSVSQSSGVFKTANSLIGAMNTPVQANTLASAKNPSRDIASASGITPVNINPSAATSTVSAVAGSITSRNSIKSDEVVVENIVLDQKNSKNLAGASAANVASGSNVTSSRSIASEAAATASGSGSSGQRFQQAGVQASAAINGGSSAGGSAASVNPIDPGAGATSLGSGQANTLRQPASLNGGSRPLRATASTNADRDEIATFISHGDYALTKQKLREPAFSRTLEQQSITVLDLYGNAFGAKKGELIFLDKGDKFVRQK